MRFRPANIRLINRRSNLPRLLLALSSGKSKNNDNYKNNPSDSARLTRSLHIRPNRVSGGQPAGMRFGDEATIDNRGNKLWSCRRSAATSQSAMDPILSLTSNPDHLISDDENPTEELPRSTALAFCPISQVRNV